MDGSRVSNSIKVEVGDAIKLMDTLENESIDLIIADPPYNLGKNYGNNLDKVEFDEYIEFSKLWLNSAKRILKPHGTIYIFMGVRYISYIYSILERELGMSFNSWITWHYTQGIGKTKGFSPRHDDILMFTKSSKFTFNIDDIRVPQKFYRDRNNMRGANPGDVWEFSHVHYCQENRQPHPTQKPEGLIERMVLASSNKSDTILDPFSGSGTTLRVCQQTYRNALGFELNPDFVQMTEERLLQPFKGFDGVDPRMARIPNDLNDDELRRIYLNNHIKWFLKNHPDAVLEFEKTVKKKYGNKIKPIQGALLLT